VRLASTVGLHGFSETNTSLRDLAPDHLAWLLVRVHSRYNTAQGQMISSMGRMEAYMDEWKSYFDGLPRLADSWLSNHSSTTTPWSGAGSVLSQGFVTCRSWAAYPTVKAFLEGVFRSLFFTPLFCLGAIFAIVRDVVICYAALMSVLGMIVATMGMLHLVGTPLGPIESLALAVIIGVSIDYLIHLAFAYKHSLMRSRYFKSRAAVLARSNSIASAALTTLCSVLPLLGAQLSPLRQFGRIFTIVTLISFFYAYCFFNAFMMVAGPLVSRRGPHADDDIDIQSAQLESADAASWDMWSEAEKMQYTGRSIRRSQILPAPVQLAAPSAQPSEHHASSATEVQSGTLGSVPRPTVDLPREL